jgi:hypothetical protein
MILMAVIIGRDAVVEVAGEGSLRHHGAEDGDGSAGELHCDIVLWNWLEDEVVEGFLESLMLKFCVDLNVVDGEELILIEVQVGLYIPNDFTPFSTAQGLKASIQISTPSEELICLAGLSEAESDSKRYYEARAS